MGSRVRAIVGTAVVLGMTAFPAGALANPAGAPANTAFGPAVATDAQEGGIGTSASRLGGNRLADDIVLRSLGLTPPGNPYQGPQNTPICGLGCAGTG